MALETTLHFPTNITKGGIPERLKMLIEDRKWEFQRYPRVNTNTEQYRKKYSHIAPEIDPRTVHPMWETDEAPTIPRTL